MRVISCYVTPELNYYYLILYLSREGERKSKGEGNIWDAKSNSTWTGRIRFGVPLRAWAVTGELYDGVRACAAGC